MGSVTESVCADDGVSQAILATLLQKIGPQKFNAWFRHGTQVGVENGHVKVAVPNSFVANWIETHYRADIAEAAQARTGAARPVVVAIDPSLAGKIRRHQLDSQARIVTRAAQGRFRRRPSVELPPLRYRFKDFVVGTSNRLAYSAALAVGSGSRPPFNPLFIHGPCGVGKTHLLQGICNSIRRLRHNGKPLNCRYVTGERFTNEFISALRQKKLPDFRARYRKLEVLAIDDVHFLAAKKATQDEFLYTFNAIASSGNQIVMASDAHPRMVGDLNDQLVNRFVAGMVAKIDPPDQATRMEILHRKARGMKLRASEEVLQYIAMHIRGSVRELEGSLIKLKAVAALENGSVSLSVATKALADHLARTDSAITVGDIEAVVAAYFGITPADIHSTRRTRTVSAARMVAMFLARRHTPMSYPEIGRYMGKNHSSVVLAVQRYESLLADGAEITWPGPLGAKSVPAAKLLEMLSEQFT